MIKFAVIGAGGIADRRTIPAMVKSNECALVAVMERVESIARAVGEKYNVPYFLDEEEMLKSVECDAVYIATPVFCHYEQVMKALKYGKHVFVEKPLCLSEKEGQEILAAFKEAGLQLTVGYMMKHHNLHEKAKELVAGDAIGKVVDVRAQFSCWYPDIEGAWRQNKALGGGGAFMDLGVHCVELIEDVLEEEIVEVKSLYNTQTFNYEVEDSAVMIFRTQSGTLGHIDVNFNIPDRACQSKLELFGTKGYILCTGTLAQEEVGTLRHLYAPQEDYSAQQNDRGPQEPVEYLGAESDLYQKQLEKFCAILKSGKPDYFYAERAVQVQRIVEKMYQN